MTRITELTPLLKRLQLGPMAATLPERIALARWEQLDHSSFLEIILRTRSTAGPTGASSPSCRAPASRKAGYKETCRVEDFDWSASITLDRRLLHTVFSLEFLTSTSISSRRGPLASARAPSPRPRATLPSPPDTPCVSSTPTASSSPRLRPKWTTRQIAPSGLSFPQTYSSSMT